MLPVATISRLVYLAKKRSKTEPATWGSAEYNRNGVTVWEVQYLNGDYSLQHYGVVLMLANPLRQNVPFVILPYATDRGISVSDQQGIHALLQILGINGYVSRAGNTISYGGVR